MCIHIKPAKSICCCVYTHIPKADNLGLNKLFPEKLVPLKTDSPFSGGH